MPKEITREEWLKELEAINNFRDGEGMTCDELASELSMSVRMVRKLLQKLLQLRRLRVGRRRMTRIDGVKAVVPVYTLAKAKRK